MYVNRLLNNKLWICLLHNIAMYIYVINQAKTLDVYNEPCGFNALTIHMSLRFNADFTVVLTFIHLDLHRKFSVTPVR